MIKVTPQLLATFIESFPPGAREAAEHDVATLGPSPRSGGDGMLHASALTAPIGLLDYALRFGSPASVECLLEAGADPNTGVPRPLTLVTMTQFCPDAGRIEKFEALLRADAKAGYVETADHVPPTPLIALARSKVAGMQRYWMARSLLAAGAILRTANDYERRVVARLIMELRAIDTILECLPPDEQAASKINPTSLDSLVSAVLRSALPNALDQLIIVKKELKLPLDFDPTAALIELAQRIADLPVQPNQAACIRLLLAQGADLQAPPEAGLSAFEHCLRFENHELAEIFIDAGAKPDHASSPELVFELMRRQGLPQRPKAAPAEPAALSAKAADSLDLLCSGIAALEACPPADLDRLSADHRAAVQALAKRLRAMANRLAPVVETLPRR